MSTELKGKVRIVALHGKAGSGKSIIAEQLEKHYGYVHLRFAQHLYDMVKQLPYLDNEERWKNREWKEAVHPFYGVSPRFILQTLGTEWGRNIVNVNLWIWCLEQKVVNLYEKHSCFKFVMDDLRFENEAEWVRKNEGLIAFVTRSAGLAVDNPSHTSEAGIRFENNDENLYNNGTLEEWEQKAKRVHELACSQSAV